MASWRIGAAATRVNPTFTASEAEYQIDDAHSGSRRRRRDQAHRPVAVPWIAVDDMATHPDNKPPGHPAPPPTEGDGLALLIYTSGGRPGQPEGRDAHPRQPCVHELPSIVQAFLADRRRPPPP